MENYIVIIRAPMEKEEAAQVITRAKPIPTGVILAVVKESDFAAVAGLPAIPSPSQEERERQAELIRPPSSESLRKES